MGRYNNNMELLPCAMADLWRYDVIYIDRDHGDHGQVLCLADMFLEQRFSIDLLVGVLNLILEWISPIDGDMNRLVGSPIIINMHYMHPDITQMFLKNNLKVY